jgi:hypothetical protein
MGNESLKWPSFATFALVWIVMSLLTWGLVCLLALVFMHGILHAGLVPAMILLPLALIPISVVTFTVQTVLFLVGRNALPGNLKANKQLLLLGTPVVTWICLAVFVWISGGPDAFVPRL